MTSTIDIRSATAADCSRLSEIALAAKAHWKYPTAWLETWRDQLAITPDHLERLAVVGAWDDECGWVGFYALSVDGREAELEHLWVDPAAMGRGVGRALFEHAVERARARGGHRVQIESDPHAQPFYEHLGARQIGEVSRPVLGTPRSLPVLALDL